MIILSSKGLKRFFGASSLVLMGGCADLSHVTLPSELTAKNWADTCNDWDDWDKVGPAYQIYGNSYYVGTCGISAILITGDQGHILIDGATEAGADIIANNIKKLGFSLADVKLLLHSHEHFDHVAGLAKLQTLSGAKLLASSEAASVISTGKLNSLDPQFGLHDTFPAARVDGLVTEQTPVTLGNLAALPISTPGHTYGALSWQWQSCENDQCLTLVYADSLSPVSRGDYHFSHYPDYIKAYSQGLTKISSLDCDILLTPHPSASKMRDRLAMPNGLNDANGCKDYATKVSKRLNRRLHKEQIIK